MKIRNEIEYAAADARALEMNSKGGRYYELQIAWQFGELSEADAAEHKALQAEYSSLCEAMQEYNAPAMQRAMNSLSQAD